MICPKCNGDALTVPCAYPDFNFRDCEHPAVAYMRAKLALFDDGTALAWVIWYKDCQPIHLSRADGWNVEAVMTMPLTGEQK